jgi:cyclopropane fatty-acyl-phospholipid synthase-like methyltransferase
VQTRKYYEAFDERFRRVHAEGVLWFPNEPSPELIQWLKEKQIPSGAEICDVGCGEGRDALYLAGLGYKIFAFDVSPEAVKKCVQLAEEKGLKIDCQIIDAFKPPEYFKNKFPWVIAIGTLHIFVHDEDRQNFLKALWQIMAAGSHCLLVNMGNGSEEYTEDPEKAFEESERLHIKKDGQIIKRVFLPQTTCRMVTWGYHLSEIKKAGFEIQKYFTSENPVYGKSMTVYLTKDKNTG